MASPVTGKTSVVFEIIEKLQNEIKNLRDKIEKLPLIQIVKIN